MMERRRWSVCVAGGRRVRALAALAAVLALGGGGVAGAGSAAASLPAASVIRASAPKATAGSVFLIGVSAVPGTEDAIAVGYLQASGPLRPVAYRWAGSAWQAMALPRQLGAGSLLSGVWAASSSDAWAVGSGSVGPVVLHWDGRAWSEVAVPGLSRSASLATVSGSSPGDVWAVGATFGGGGSGATSVSPVELHYNGRSWAASQVAPAGVGLYRVSVVSPTDVWALGVSSTGRSSSLAHFDGRTWTVVGLPGASGAALGGVGASGPSVWVVGSAGTSLVSWHLAGGRWTKAAMPPPERGKMAFASGVVALAGGTAWTAGTVAGTAFTEHLAGGRWTVVRVPPGGNGASLESISAAGPTNVWAVGGFFVGAVCRSPSRPLAYHFVSGWKAAPFAGGGAAVARIQPDC